MFWEEMSGQFPSVNPVLFEGKTQKAEKAMFYFKDMLLILDKI